MTQRLQKALVEAHAVLADIASVSVEKTIWSSPAGKKRLAPRLVKLIPKHRVYVEPFAGSAAVFFEKEPAEVEALNDGDPDIARAYSIIQRMDAKRIDQLRKMTWKGDRSTFEKLYDAEPKGDLPWLHRFLYLARFSYGGFRGRSFSPADQGNEATTPRRLEKLAPRLAKARIHSGDYESVVRKYDGTDAFFFLDPPYAGYNAQVGESKFDEQRFFKALESIKGKWLLTYGARGELPKLLAKAGYPIKRIRTSRTISPFYRAGKKPTLSQIVVANYDLATKAAEPASMDWEFEPVEPPPTSIPGPVGGLRDEAADGRPVLRKVSTLLKGMRPEDERYVLGVVLVPEQTDAQGDIYSHEEVRQAAHRFMESFGDIGLMHRSRVGDEVKVLESYLAPTDFEVSGTSIVEGTWLLALRITSDDLWSKIKAGDLAGFSIGGSARTQAPTETPEEEAEPAREPE